MPAVKITFELEPGDIERFHEALARAQRRVACAEECDIVDAARHALDTLPIAAAPGYIRRQIQEVAGLLDMLEDEAWALPQVERAQVLRLLAYFSDPEDLIPDDVAVIGLLDDAIMLELLMKRIRARGGGLRRLRAGARPAAGRRGQRGPHRPGARAGAPPRPPAGAHAPAFGARRGGRHRQPAPLQG